MKTLTHTIYHVILEGFSPMFLSPAVTPWKSTLPGVGYNNPSIRLYAYNRSSLDILDYSQYYLNLTKANEGKRYIVLLLVNQWIKLSLL